MIDTDASGKTSEEKILATLHFVANLSGSPDFLNDVYFTQERVILLRLGRKSLCRVAVGMAGAINSSDESSILRLVSKASKNLNAISYDQLLHLRLSIDSNSKKTLELQFVKKRSMLFLLDKNQFDSMKNILPTIEELRNRLSLSIADQR